MSRKQIQDLDSRAPQPIMSVLLSDQKSGGGSPGPCPGNIGYQSWTQRTPT